MVPLLLVACLARPGGDSGIDIPGHDDCLEPGERYSDATCEAVVDDFDRVATVSENKAPTEAPADDPRLADPELQWVSSEVDRCACRCCHTTGLGGAGVYFWDTAFTPVWVDSASDWTLSVFGGWTGEVDQTLPTSDLDRLRAWIEGEWDRRAQGGA